MKKDVSSLDTDSNSNDNTSNSGEENKDYCKEYCMCAILSSNLFAVYSRTARR